jgi:hypothetical protein
VERRQHDQGYEARAEEQVEMCQSANESWNEHRLLSCEIEMADQLRDPVACALGGSDQLAEPLLGLSYKGLLGFALNRPALLSAPSQKWFSSVSLRS